MLRAHPPARRRWPTWCATRPAVGAPPGAIPTSCALRVGPAACRPATCVVADSGHRGDAGRSVHGRRGPALARRFCAHHRRARRGAAGPGRRGAAVMGERDDVARVARPCSPRPPRCTRPTTCASPWSLGADRAGRVAGRAAGCRTSWSPDRSGRRRPQAPDRARPGSLAALLAGELARRPTPPRPSRGGAVAGAVARRAAGCSSSTTAGATHGAHAAAAGSGAAIRPSSASRTCIWSPTALHEPPEVRRPDHRRRRPGGRRGPARGAARGRGGRIDPSTAADGRRAARALAPLRLSAETRWTRTRRSAPTSTSPACSASPTRTAAGRGDACGGRARSATSCACPIGVDDDGEPVLLDLKESAQLGMGPHGLCVGATGSGKSELLRTLVLGAGWPRTRRRSWRWCWSTTRAARRSRRSPGCRTSPA